MTNEEILSKAKERLWEYFDLKGHSVDMEYLNKVVLEALQLKGEQMEKRDNLNNALIKEGYSKMEYYEKLSIQLKAELSELKSKQKQL